MIDRKGTRAHIRASQFSLVGWCKWRGQNYLMVNKLLSGQLNESSPAGRKIVDALRADGLLLETDDKEEAA